MPEGHPPVLHILAGPNGAGKSTLYQQFVRPRVDAPFVNADLLVHEALGRHPIDRAEAELGQKLANELRDSLMEAREDLVTESTFSHPSKLALIRQAHDLGYWVIVYHVNLNSPDLAIKRVGERLAEGGHPVPEANVRGRYERNKPLIREAVHTAEFAFVFDNSRKGLSPRLLLEFEDGKLQRANGPLPAWASSLYSEDLKTVRTGR